MFYEIFSRLIYNRISFHLFSYQFFDQLGFTPGIRIEDALLCAEVVIEHHLEFNLEVNPHHGYEKGFRHDRSQLIDGGATIQRVSRRVYMLVIHAVYKSKGIRRWKFRVSNPTGSQAR